jgi:sigma-E factor negative regulatory protein RseB
MARTKVVGFRSLLGRPVVTALLPLLIAIPAFAQDKPDAMGWIQKMASAMAGLSYEGKFVYLHDGRLEAMSILHINDSMGRRERLVSLNGEAREILRDENNLTCVWPSSKQIVVDQSKQKSASPIWIPEDVERLSKFYDFSVAGEDRVADRPAVVISIMPKDQFRYGMRVWLDQDNALLLQSEVVDGEGRKVEQIMFTEMALLDDSEYRIFTTMPEVGEGYALIRSHSGTLSEDRQPADINWRMEAVPEGFWLDEAFRKRMVDSGVFTQQMIYTDGMASVSVFIEPGDQQQLDGESSMGAVNAFSHRYQDHSITAIGEVPAITVRNMAMSIVYNR